MITEQDVIEYVKDDLGLGIVNLELDDDNIKRNIKRVFSDVFILFIPTYKTIDVTSTSSSEDIYL